MPIQIQDIHDQDDIVDCPLCMETLEVDDINFFPCECGYQICRFCWHRIRTDGNGLCPACRKPYPENPAEFKPLTDQELQKIRQDKKQKEVARKQKITDSRKHLANVRVLQKNLVFVVGLSQRLADIEILKRPEYFGKYGKILKVVLNSNTSYAGSQSPSCSAYVTYSKMEEALRAIQSVNNVHIDGRTLKASLGTTKYCSNYLKNQVCQKHDCMYLHEIGDDDASFTKEDMQMAKHQEYEQKLIQQMIQKEIQQEMKAKAIRQEGSSENEDGYTGTSPPSSANTITSALSVAQAVKKNTKMASETTINNHARRHSVSASSDTPDIQEPDAQSKNSDKGLKLSSSVGDKDSGGNKATNSNKVPRRATSGKKISAPPSSQAPRHKKQPQQNASQKKVSSSLECASTLMDDVMNVSGSADTSVESSPSLTPIQNESLSSVRTPYGSISSEMFSSTQDTNFSEDSLTAIGTSALPIDIPVSSDDINRNTPLSDTSSSIGCKSPYVCEGITQDSNVISIANSAETSNSAITKSRFMMPRYKEGGSVPAAVSNGLGFSPFGMNPSESSLFQDLPTQDSPMTNSTQNTFRMMPPPGLSVLSTGQSNWPVHNSRLPDSMPIQSSHDWEAGLNFKSMTKETISSADDDLGFDPWIECSKGLADLVKEEKSLKSASTTNMGNQMPSSFSNLISQPRRPTFLQDRNQPRPPQMRYSCGSDLVNGFSNLFSSPAPMFQQQNKLPFPSEQSRFLPQQRLGPDPHPLLGQNNTQTLLSPGSPVTPTKDPLILKGNHGKLQDMQNEFRALLPSVNINFTNQNHSHRLPAGHNLDLSLGLSNLGMAMGGPKHPISHPPGIGNMPMQNNPFMNRQHAMPPGYSNRPQLLRQPWNNSEPNFLSQGMSLNRMPGPVNQHSLFPSYVAGSESEQSQNFPPDPAIIHGGGQGFGQNMRRNRLFENSFPRPMGNASNNTVDEQPHWMKSLQALMEQDTPTSPGPQPPSSIGQGFTQQRTNTAMASWPTMTGLFPSNHSNFSNSQPPPGFQVRPSLAKPTEFGALQSNLLDNQS